MATPQSLCQIQLNCGDEDAADWQGFGAGILIHPQWVLTAAHVSKVATEPELLRVALGDPPSQVAATPQGRTFIPVKSQHTHPDFTPENDFPVNADMALLLLAEPVTDFNVQPFLVNWDWYQSRWQHRQLHLQFWGRPFQEGYAEVVENDKRLHAVRRDESDGVLGLQIATEDNTELAIQGGIPNGFSGGPVLATLRSGEHACVGLTVQGGALFGKAASTSYALSTCLILPWLDEFTKSEAYQENQRNDKLYQTVDAKEDNSFSIFNWRPADDYQNLYDEDDIGALLTWNTALSPLIGRTREQKEFNHWLDRIKQQKHPDLTVRVVHGEGGVGKTRFVCEWAEGCSKQGWQVADASRTDWQDIKDALETDSSLPWLIVLDYPELNQNLLEALDVLSKAASETQQNIALILLSRHDESRWQPAFEEGKLKGLAIDYYPLQPIAPEPSYQLLSKLLVKLNAQDVKVDSEDYLHWLRYDAAKTPDGRRYMEYPLMILGQAVCLAKDSTLDFKKLSHDKVLEALVKIVQRKLNLAEKQNGVKQDSVQWGISQRLNMLAILLGSIQSRTMEILSQEKNCSRLGLTREQSEVSLKLVSLNVLRKNTLQPMTPDVFATAFAATVFEQMDEPLQVQFPHWCAILLENTNIAEALERFNQRYSDSVFGLKKPFKSAYHGLLEAFKLKANLMGKEQTLHYFDNQENMIASLGAKVFAHRIEELKNSDTTKLISHDAELAQYLNNLSLYTSKSGDYTVSLKSNLESVEVYRGLAENDYTTYAPGLGMSLANLSCSLVDLGDLPGGLRVNFESVEIYRDLAEANFSVYGSGLAWSLANLSVHLKQSGDITGGLQAIKESVELYRGFASLDFAAFSPGLAESLNILSGQLADSGDHSRGLLVAQEALEIRRSLARDNFTAYGPSLANSLTNLSTRLAECGNSKDGLDVIIEAVEVYRALAEDNFAFYAPKFASSLNNFSNRLAEQGDLSRSLEVICESVKIIRALTEDNFTLHGQDLALYLNNLSIRLADFGNHSGGLDANTESLEIYRALSKENFFVYGPRMAMSLHNLSNRTWEMGNHLESLKLSIESVDLYRSLSKENFSVYGPSLATGLTNLCGRLASTGDRPSGLQAVEEAIEINKDFAKENFSVYGPSYGSSLYFYFIFQPDHDVLRELHRVYKAISCESHLAWINAYPEALTQYLSYYEQKQDSKMIKIITKCLNELCIVGNRNEDLV